MANVKISIHNRNLETRKEGIKSWAISEEDKRAILEFLDDLELGKVNKGKKISETRQVKYLDILKMPLEYFKKSTSRLTLKDMEDFEKDLSSNKILSYKNKPYELSTKADIRRLLKIYLKWKLGDTEKYRNLTDWLDTREARKTPDYLSEQHMELLYKNCKNSYERYLIAVLFDSGARAEEFHNIRYEDIQLPNANESYVKVTIKEEYSKTLTRTISLFWKYSLEAVRNYVKEREAEGIKLNEPVFKNSYDNTRQFLSRLSQKVLKRPVHYHLFRHSSATYYASRLNRQQLCYRYGWKFSSDMPDVYISRSGMENKELDEKFASTELETIRKDNERLKTEFGMTKIGLENEMSEFKKTQEEKNLDLEIKVRNMQDLAGQLNAINSFFLEANRKDKTIAKKLKEYAKKFPENKLALAIR